ncbi:hypothetical protein Tsubulata_017779 [Turnera subulata]|uniref:DM2 domain-containing protein n=1 Tax=Turnera subulata TaxID=218843 RepID=A0A9Q0FET1_9ROSI|nr:hypothetical protein Tsubulata_017779 [Turnera subulata]
MVSDSDLVSRLHEILRSSDLDTATPGSIRRQLQSELGVDLSDRKAFISEQIDIFFRNLSTGGEGEVKAENVESNEGEEEDGENENDAVEEEEEEEMEEEEDDDDDEESEGKGGKTKRSKKEVKEVKKKRGGFTKICSLSPQLQEFVGVPELARTEVVKKLWAYIREKELQDPKNKRIIRCDESLRALFRVNSINMFQMNKVLAKHIWPLNEGDGIIPFKTVRYFIFMLWDGSALSCLFSFVVTGTVNELMENWDTFISRYFNFNYLKQASTLQFLSIIIYEMVKPEVRCEDSNDSESAGDDAKEEEEGQEDDEDEEADRKKERKGRTKKGGPAKVDTDAKRKGGGFTKLCSLSPELQEFIGESELARTGVVKKLWAYIRENNLQDPKNKRNIICDESLRTLFQVDSIDMFQMNKALSKHIWPLNEAAEDSSKKETRDKKGREEGEISRFEFMFANMDSSDKRRTICDDKLKELFEVDSFHGFSVSKLLMPHFLSKQSSKMLFCR